MNIMKKKVLASIVLLFIMMMNQKCLFQTNVVELLNELKGSRSFPTVDSIRAKLVNQGKTAIPFLIEVLKDTTYVKLTETGDLIYPGSTKFPSHGYIINHAIDWCSVRAGWILEELTFQDFGYRKNQVSEAELMALAKSIYSSEYVQSDGFRFEFKHETQKQRIIAFRKLLAIKVENWWKINQGSWNRFVGLKDALVSKNTYRINIALDYLRVGTSQCADLNRESFNEELKPLLRRIRLREEHGISEHAKMILKDKQYKWLDKKKQQVN